MSQENWTKLWKFVAAVALALSAFATTMAGIALWAPVEEAVPRAYQCEVYTEQGCAKYVVASGGELEILSGGTLDIQSGATTDFSGGIDLDGGLLDLDADGDTSIQADTDDQIDIEIATADDFQFTANTFTVLAGSMITLPATADINAYGYVAVGDGTPDGSVSAGTDEELYVEGDFEVDGEAEFDGTLDFDGTTFDVDSTGAVSIDADVASNFSVAGAGIDLDFVSASGSMDIKANEAISNAIHLDANETVTTGIDIDVGSVSGLMIDGGLTNIGGGTPDVADGDNDLYVTGVLEVDDELELDGALDADSTANIAGNLTLGAFLYLSAADETITDGETLTPTVTVYNLDSGGAVTMTLGACSTDGQPLILVGDDANNITINDTNVRTNDGGVQVIGQFDVITWICIDAEWVEVSESNNS